MQTLKRREHCLQTHTNTDTEHTHTAHNPGWDSPVNTPVLEKSLNASFFFFLFFWRGDINSIFTWTLSSNLSALSSLVIFHRIQTIVVFALLTHTVLRKIICLLPDSLVWILDKYKMQAWNYYLILFRETKTHQSNLPGPVWGSR